MKENLPTKLRFFYYILFVDIYVFLFFFQNLHWHESVDQIRNTGGSLPLVQQFDICRF